MFCEKIEEIGKVLRDMRLSENLKEYFLEIRQYFFNVMNAYLKKDLMNAHKAWLGKDEILKRAESKINTLGNEEKDKIKDMIRIAENCKDMVTLILVCF